MNHEFSQSYPGIRSALFTANVSNVVVLPFYIAIAGISR